MIALVTQQRDKIAEHCHRLNVRRLEVFGSAVNGNFDSEKSDLDFLVEFGKQEQVDLLTRYLDLAESLEALFNRKVDLVTTAGSAKNPRFRANIDAEKELIYAS